MYWRRHIVNNCEGIEDLPAVIAMTTSITNSVTTTQSVAEKVTVANQAIELLKNWVKIGVTSETTYTWTKAKTKEFAEGKIVTLGSNGSNGKLVKPGWKWVVSQLVGTASFTEISTDKYKSTDVQCST